MSVGRKHSSLLGRSFLSTISVAALTAVAVSGFDAAAQGKGQAGGQGGQGAGKGQAMQGGGHGKSADERGGMGGRGSLGGLFRDLAGEDTDDGEDSDRPEWAGTPGGGSDHGGGRPDMAGSKGGDLFGDLWVIERDEDGVPILYVWQDTDGDGVPDEQVRDDEGFVQPLDAAGEPIPLDVEGHPIDEDATIEVELGRLNVGRAPNSVLDRRAEEVITLLQTATDLTTDAAGRMVVTTPDGEVKTIDSPLENLGIYLALLTNGFIAIPDPDDSDKLLTDLPGTDFDYLVDGTYDPADLAGSAVFLAAATDKTGEFTTDEIAYINAFLGVNTTTVGDVTYSDIDYSDFEYDRESVYGDVTATVLVWDDATLTWVPQENVNIFDAVFDGESSSGSGTLDAYALAADDARAVVNFLHEYEVPAPTTN